MRYFLCCLCSVFLYGRALCQLGVGTGEQLFITNGTIFSTDSLVFIPSVNQTWNDINIVPAYVPVPGVTSGTNSIARVYPFSKAIIYSGDLGIVYQDDEHAGNTESSLQIAYDNYAWNTTTSSIINTSTNWIYNTVSNAVVDGVTATNTGVVLPVTYTGFTAVLQEKYVHLNWKMGVTEGLTAFDVQYSNDGRNWSTADQIRADEYTRNYSYRHYDLNFNTRHYRIASYETSGAVVYTHIVTIRNGRPSNNLRIAKNGSELLLYFYGKTPEQVQVLDMKGQLLQAARVVQQPLRIGNLVPGSYVIHFVVDGKKQSRLVVY